MNVCCIGAANIDIKIDCFQPLMLDESLSSNIELGIGGVGTNIAYNLAMLKVKTKLVTALSNDIFGQYIRNRLTLNFLDLSDAQTCDHNSSFYVDLNSCVQNYGFNDMKIINDLCSEKILDVLNKIAHYNYVCIDLNLPESILQLVFQNCYIPIVCDATSVLKSKKVLPYLNKVDILKCNLKEAMHLSSCYEREQSDKDLVHVARILSLSGAQQVYITLGKEGALFYDRSECIKISPKIKYDKHFLGAGDAFTAAVIYGHIRKWSKKDILIYASYLAMDVVNNDSIHIVDSHLSKINNSMNQRSFEELFEIKIL